MRVNKVCQRFERVLSSRNSFFPLIYDQKIDFGIKTKRQMLYQKIKILPIPDIDQTQICREQSRQLGKQNCPN